MFTMRHTPFVGRVSCSISMVVVILHSDIQLDAGRPMALSVTMYKSSTSLGTAQQQITKKKHRFGMTNLYFDTLGSMHIFDMRPKKKRGRTI